MIVTNSQGQPNSQQLPTNVSDNGQLRANTMPPGNVQLRRAESSKSSSGVPNTNNVNANINNANLNSSIMTTANNHPSGNNKQRPNQFQHNVTSSHSVSTPAYLNSPPAASSGLASQNIGCATNDEGSSHTFHYDCSRYFLFLVYMLLLLSLILNTFLHFIIYGSNMSIGALFLDVHHRHELVIGDYYSLDLYTTDIYLNSPYHRQPASPSHRPNSELIHCDRETFLSFLEEFYHMYPKPPVDSSSSMFDNNRPVYGSPANGNDQNRQPNRSKSYPKIFTTFKNSRPDNMDEQKDKDEMYYSSSSTADTDEIQSSNAHKIIYDNNQWQRQTKNENRLLVIEIVALIMLFVLVITQVLGLIAVMRKHQLLLIFVTAIDTLLFSVLVFFSNFGLLILVLLAIFVGFWFIFEIKFGTKKYRQSQQKLKDEICNEIRDLMTQNNRTTPCVHVSMEQYEAMTQQMIHRYSSPIVYCPHYNESLC